MNWGDVQVDDEDESEFEDAEEEQLDEDDGVDDQQLLAHITKHSKFKNKKTTGSVSKLLSKTHGAKKETKKANKATRYVMTINGKRYVQINMNKIEYTVSTGNRGPKHDGLSLVNRGANGGLAGADTRMIKATDRVADVTCLDDHRV